MTMTDFPSDTGPRGQPPCPSRRPVSDTGKSLQKSF